MDRLLWESLMPKLALSIYIYISVIEGLQLRNIFFPNIYIKIFTKMGRAVFKLCVYFVLFGKWMESKSLFPNKRGFFSFFFLNFSLNLGLTRDQKMLVSQ